MDTALRHPQPSYLRREITGNERFTYPLMNRATSLAIENNSLTLWQDTPSSNICPYFLSKAEATSIIYKLCSGTWVSCETCIRGW